MNLTLATMKTTKIRNPKNDEIHKRIVKAYCDTVKADDVFHESLKKYAPAFELKVGDKILLTRNKGNKPIRCVVQQLSYNPYSGNSFGGWHTMARPCDKNWRITLFRRYTIFITPGMEIELVTN